jgi:hypothetical protein
MGIYLFFSVTTLTLRLTILQAGWAIDWAGNILSEGAYTSQYGERTIMTPPKSLPTGRLGHPEISSEALFYIRFMTWLLYACNHIFKICHTN